MPLALPLLVSQWLDRGEKHRDVWLKALADTSPIFLVERLDRLAGGQVRLFELALDFALQPVVGLGLEEIREKTRIAPVFGLGAADVRQSVDVCRWRRVRILLELFETNLCWKERIADPDGCWILPALSP